MPKFSFFLTSFGPISTPEKESPKTRVPGAGAGVAHSKRDATKNRFLLASVFGSPEKQGLFPVAGAQGMLFIIQKGFFGSGRYFRSLLGVVPAGEHGKCSKWP